MQTSVDGPEPVIDTSGLFPVLMQPAESFIPARGVKKK
jgi:hypothetical protein